MTRINTHLDIACAGRPTTPVPVTYMPRPIQRDDAQNLDLVIASTAAENSACSTTMTVAPTHENDVPENADKAVRQNTSWTNMENNASLTVAASTVAAEAASKAAVTTSDESDIDEPARSRARYYEQHFALMVTSTLARYERLFERDEAAKLKEFWDLSGAFA